MVAFVFLAPQSLFCKIYTNKAMQHNYKAAHRILHSVGCIFLHGLGYENFLNRTCFSVRQIIYKPLLLFWFLMQVISNCNSVTYYGAICCAAVIKCCALLHMQ